MISRQASRSYSYQRAGPKLSQIPCALTLFFDVTTLYFESIDVDDARNFGYSKDNKFKETQIMLALVTTHEGLPLTYLIFPGNTYEGHTLVHAVDELKKSYDVERVLFVADRAMFNETNLKALEDSGIHYIVAARLKSLPKTLKNEILNNEFYKATKVDNELHWTKTLAYKDRRLIVSYSSKRARKDAADRQRLIDRLLKKVGSPTESVGGFNLSVMKSVMMNE